VPELCHCRCRFLETSGKKDTLVSMQTNTGRDYSGRTFPRL
jgi:hypothetical protein